MFGRDGRVVARAQKELEQILPAPGLVEHDPEAIWTTQLAVARRAMADACLSAADVAALGVTNQRETTILWDRYNRPAGGQRRGLAEPGERRNLRSAEVGWLRAQFPGERLACCWTRISPGTKIKHLLDAHDGLRARARNGEILFGTVDSWLIWPADRRAGGTSPTIATPAAR